MACLTFDVDGTFAASAVSALGGGLVSANAHLFFRGGIDAGIIAFIQLTLGDLSPPPNGDTFLVGFPDPLPHVLVIDVPTTLGTPGVLRLALSAAPNDSLFGADGTSTASATVDFDSTFTLRLAQVLDENRNPISDATILSANNFVYPTRAVLEPSMLLLMAAALAVASVLCRKRRRTRYR